MSDQTDGWHEHSKLVLHRIDTLSSEFKKVTEEIQSMRIDITKINERADKINDIKDWKDKMTAVIQPDQLKTHLTEHKENRDFTIKAVTVMYAIQFLISGAVIWMKLFNK